MAMLGGLDHRLDGLIRIYMDFLLGRVLV